MDNLDKVIDKLAHDREFAALFAADCSRALAAEGLRLSPAEQDAVDNIKRGPLEGNPC